MNVSDRFSYRSNPNAREQYPVSTTDLKDMHNGLVKHMSAGAKTDFWDGQKPRRDAYALYLSTANFRLQTTMSDCGWSTTRFPLPGTTWDCRTRRRHTARTLWLHAPSSSFQSCRVNLRRSTTRFTSIGSPSSKRPCRRPV